MKGRNLMCRCNNYHGVFLQLCILTVVLMSVTLFVFGDYFKLNNNHSTMYKIYDKIQPHIMDTDIQEEKGKTHGKNYVNETVLRNNTKNRFREFGPLDIMHIKSFHFLDNYKNPCWFGTASPGKLLCLPYVYIIGVKKSGTTDLWNRILKHPDVVAPGFLKESQWLALGRFGLYGGMKPNLSINQSGNDPTQRRYNPKYMDFFINLFDGAAKQIERHTVHNHGRRDFHPLITGEASPSNLHKNTIWTELPGNRGLTEPKYTNLDYIKHITPDAKIIVIFRDPVDRIYSEFLHVTKPAKRTPTTSDFHKRASRAIKVYGDCFQQATTRSCVYNETALRQTYNNKGNIDLHFELGLYSVYYRDLVRVFSHDQLMVIYMPDYIEHRENTLEKVFSFLGLRKLTGAEMVTILHEPIQLRRNKLVPMLDKTRKLLYEFYRPFNEEMAQLLHDDRFLFIQE